MKDYDAYPGNHPSDWPARFDISTWGFLVARIGGTRVGGAVVVAGDETIDKHGGCTESAVLHDLRVAPAFRRRGVARRLLCAAEAWARRRHARVLVAETQDVNVVACRFYLWEGFMLQAFEQGAYPDLPAEARLLWARQLNDRDNLRER